MTDPLVRPDPADQVPPGERAALAAAARELAESNVALRVTVAGLTHKLTFRTRVFVAVIVLDVLLTLAIVFVGYRYENGSSCQAAQNDAFKAAIIERNEAAGKERAAQRQLFNVVLNPASTPADRLKASQTYYAGLVAADQQRAENPFPDGNCP